VVIVGAGPTGLTAASLLASYGIPSTVLDRYAQPYPSPRAVHLDGESARVLQLLGLAEEFAAISRPAAGLRLLDARLRPFAEFRRDDTAPWHGHPESNLFDQPDLEALLRAHLARQPAVALRGRVTVTGLTGNGVRLRDEVTGRGEQLPAAAVLGCDGAGSTIAGAIGTRFRDLAFTQRWFVVDARCSARIAAWGGVDQVCDPRRAATFMHLTGDRYRWEFRMHPGESGADLARPEHLNALLAPWLQHAPESECDVLRSAAYTFRARIAQTWRRGHVLLLGDAAHLTPPFIGQGLGAGLRDAHNLAWKLAAVLHEQVEDPDDLLESYHAERGPHVEAVIRTAVRVGRVMTGGQGAAAALPRPALAALLRLPGAQNRALAGITTRHPAGRWVQARPRRRSLAGTPCPQPLVQIGSRAARLDDVLGTGFALLSTAPPAPDLRDRAHALRARTIRLRSAPEQPETASTAWADSAITDDGTLSRWLRRGRATTVLLRPDRIVLAASRAGTPVPG
jgi:3-(3-hydroxy-phenyl)propionate hydroxylase